MLLFLETPIYSSTVKKIQASQLLLECNVLYSYSTTSIKVAVVVIMTTKKLPMIINIKSENLHVKECASICHYIHSWCSIRLPYMNHIVAALTALLHNASSNMTLTEALMIIFNINCKSMSFPWKQYIIQPIKNHENWIILHHIVRTMQHMTSTLQWKCTAHSLFLSLKSFVTATMVKSYQHENIEKKATRQEQSTHQQL